jgi:hypothetical protein
MNRILQKLAARLGVGPQALESRLRGSSYRRRPIQQKRHTRMLRIPDEDLMAAQHVLTEMLSGLPVHSAAHGFVTGRSTLTNARAHAGAAVIVGLDLRHFYDSISAARLEGELLKAAVPVDGKPLVLSHTEACFLVELCASGDTLPQGAPTSPLLSNWVAWELDRRLSALARRLRFQYTRYVDDLTFSSLEPASSGLQRDELGQRVELLLRLVPLQAKACGFGLNVKKVKVLWPHQRQEVTGLVVNGGPGAGPPVRAPRKLRRQLRAALHNRGHASRPRLWTDAQIRGGIAFVGMADPKEGARLVEEFKGESK